MNNKRKRLHNQVDPQGDKLSQAGKPKRSGCRRRGSASGRVAEARRPGGREATPAPFLDINVTHPHTDSQQIGGMTWLP